MQVYRNVKMEQSHEQSALLMKGGNHHDILIEVMEENDDDDRSYSVVAEETNTTVTQMDDKEEEVDDFMLDPSDDDNEELPLWYYQRLKRQQQQQEQQTTTVTTTNNNTIPYCTTSMMGKVILNSTTSIWTPTVTTTATALSSNINDNDLISSLRPTTPVSKSSSSSFMNTNQHDDYDNIIIPPVVRDSEGIDDDDDDDDDMMETTRSSSPTGILPHKQTWYNQTIYIVVTGYSNGQIGLTEATTDAPIVNTTITTTASDSIGTVNTTTSGQTTTNPIHPTFPDMNHNHTNSGWYVTPNNNNNNNNSPIASVSIDATGTVITAIDQNGNCSIWTVKYSIQYQSLQQQQQQQETASTTSTSTTTNTTNQPVANSGNLLTKLFWRNTAATTATTVSDAASTTATTNATMNVVEVPKRMVPTLTMVDVKVTRLQPYSETIYGGIPTCICLDPQFILNYRFIVSFTSGKLVLTSRNWMRRYEEHTILPYFHHQQQRLPTPNNKHENHYWGIETIAWRASMIAFADSSGINLYDIQSYKPIARVDRPIGAQPSLYHFMNPYSNNNNNNTTTGENDDETNPILSTDDSNLGSMKESVGRIKPHLYFETSRSLLVAWGDCLMTLSISDTVTAATTTTATSVERKLQSPLVVTRSANVTSTTTSSTSTSNMPLSTSSNNNNNISQVRKRTVACTMAWALDGIVAADVVPIDERHIAILGHVLLDDDDDVDVAENDKRSNNNNNRVSSQRIISNPYEMELQILDRTNGSILYSDLLQLQQPTIGSSSINHHLESYFNQHCRLLSSFAVPRMDDVLELKEEKGDYLVDTTTTTPAYIDSHLRWNLGMVSFPNSISTNEASNNEISKYDNDDTDSVDSDEYSFLLKTPKESSPDTLIYGTVTPPILLIVSDIDMVVARVRDVDDAIHFALEHQRPALALHWALISRTHQLRRYTMNELIHIFLRALLRLPKKGTTISPISKRSKRKKIPGAQTRKLSLRRMTLAAQSLPILLGGNVEMWKVWILVLEKIPGALFVVRKYIPVRDPKLPKALYARILTKMLEEVESMRQYPKPDMSDRLVVEAEGHFLNTLLAWGTTRSLKEHVKLFEYQANIDISHNIMIHRTIESLRYRYEQSAVGYLDPTSPTSTFAQSEMSDAQLVITSSSVDINDSLYNAEEVFAELAHRVSIITLGGDKLMSMKLPSVATNSRVAIDAMAKIHVMNNSYDEALKCFLVLSTVHSSKSLEDVDEDALKIVNNDGKEKVENDGAYSFVLHLIEVHHLHQNLLDATFLPEGISYTPICALIRLVGLDLAGEFLIQNCTAPQQHVSSKAGAERRGTLPLDLVADQLSGNPKLFHWYLHIVSNQKPELYVKFPTTANPPPVITTLHKKHLDLYIRYAGPNRDSNRVLDGLEAYLVAEKTTPLLSFLKVVLHLGTIGPIEVGKLLEIERRGGAGVSRTFALELAYIMENYGNKNEADALVILELFLKGAQSLMLAVSFAQRTRSHSAKLWEKLIEHCLLKSSIEKSSDGSFSGILFGSLLEASAISGADLSHLVSQIPEGMQVEGLRPRLIAAVADYRLKVQLHSKANEIAAAEKGALFLEAARRFRGGMRYENSHEAPINARYEVAITDDIVGVGDEIALKSQINLSPRLRPRNRLNRYSHPLLLPIR